jgi:quaternary ammonium compound-resistance protein SugE
LEVVWTGATKRCQGFTQPVPSVVTVAAALGSFVLPALAMRSLPLGTAYTVWTGIGAMGAYLLGLHGGPDRHGLVLMKPSGDA